MPPQPTTKQRMFSPRGVPLLLDGVLDLPFVPAPGRGAPFQRLMAGALHLPPVSRIEPGGSRVFGMQAWGLCKIGSLRTVDKWPCTGA